MKYLNKKAATLSGLAAVSLFFCIFILFLFGYDKGLFSADGISFTDLSASGFPFRQLGISILAIILFLSCVIFLAVIKAPFWYTLVTILPVKIMLVALFGVLPAIYFLLFSSLPLLILHRRVTYDLSNRINFQLARDIRSPLTVFFLFTFFIAAFAAAPVSNLLMTGALKMFAQPTISRSLSAGDRPIDANAPVQSLIDSEVKKRIGYCQGNSACEDEIRIIVGEEVKNQLFSVQMREQISDEELLKKPLAEVATDRSFEQLFSDSRLPTSLSGSIVPNLFWSFALFLLLAPLSFIFAGITALFTSILFQLFLVVGVFRVEKQSVKQDVVF